MTEPGTPPACDAGSAPPAGGAGAPLAGAGGSQMWLEVNGEHGAFPAGITVDQVVTAVAPTRNGIAVAVNSEVLPRSAWPDAVLSEGDRVEVLTAAQGG
ncbi:MAG: sulfur carrier protein ThiS [Acidimicrobiales bacterium]